MEEKVPALQLVQMLEPVADHEPATHDEQTDEEVAPMKAEKVPEIQAVHVA